jgi:hypothetical protein
VPTTLRRSLPTAFAAALLAALVVPAAARAQVVEAAAPDTARGTNGARPTSSRQWGRFALGAASSIALHELGHVLASYALGARPSFGFDGARPTVYSGISERLEPRKQFLFSSAGLDAQLLLDETILDVPHRRGGAFERGLLAGGLGTVAFYVTIGRNAPVSDVTRMAATSSLTRGQVSLIYGGVSALHAVRIARSGYYGKLFVAPGPDGELRVGVRGTPRRATHDGG